jgi:hypothetical protein
MIDAQIECFGHIQVILVCAGVASSILWPRPGPDVSPDLRKTYELRGERLRQRFRMGNKSPLKEKYVRNAVMHVDERIDNYYFAHSRDKIRDFSLVFDVPADWKPSPGVSVPRAYIFPANVVLWFEERADLQSIAFALRDLRDRFAVTIRSARRTDDGTTQKIDGSLLPP